MGIIMSLLGIVCILYYLAGVRYAGYRVSGLWIWLAAGMYETISGESRNQQGTSDPGTKIHHNQTESSIQQKIYGLST